MKPTIVNDVEYKFEDNSGKLFFQITNHLKPIKPKTLFKYYSLNDYNIDALINGYIYATHPNDFNDVFDTFFNIIKFDNPDINYSFLTEKMNYSSEKATEKLNDQNHIAKNFKDIIYREIGVVSLTSDDDNLLMWSYYTNHKGFCLEFDYSKFDFTFHGPFPINYIKSLSPLSLIEKFNNSLELAMLVQSNIKFEGWKHEDEWRILVEAPCEMISPFQKIGHNRKFKYSVEAIKSITLGMKFFDLHNQVDKIINVNDEEQIIEIKSNLKQKSLILDFIIKHNIPTKLSHEYLNNDNIFSINFIDLIVEKVNENKYKFKVNKSLSN